MANRPASKADEKLTRIIVRNLIQFREESGLTRPQVRAHMGLSERMLAEIEGSLEPGRVSKVPNLIDAKLLCDLYGRSLSDLVSEAPPRKRAPR